MTEAELLEHCAKELASLVGELDDLLLNASEAQWQFALPDNKWTTGQIVEHIYRTSLPYETLLSDAFAKASHSDQTSDVKHPIALRMILLGLRSKRVPAPNQLIVIETISQATGLLHWASFKKASFAHLEMAKGKSLWFFLV